MAAIVWCAVGALMALGLSQVLVPVLAQPRPYQALHHVGDFEFRKFRLYLWALAYQFYARNMECYRMTLHKPQAAT